MTKQELRETVSRIIKQELSEGPATAPSKPSTNPGPAVAPGKPDEKKGPRRPLGNPNVKPKPKAKATIDEAEVLKQIIKRFKSKKNMNEAGKTWAEGYEEGYNIGFKDSSNGKPNKFKK
jgi:hypothetical protein